MNVCYAMPDGDEIDNVIADKSTYKHIIMLNQVVYLQKIDGSAMDKLVLETLEADASNSDYYKIHYYKIRIEFTNDNHHTFTYANKTVRDTVFAELVDALNKYHSR